MDCNNQPSHRETNMHLSTQSTSFNSHSDKGQSTKEIVSCWRLGKQITGNRWYDIYRAAPKSVSPESDHDFVIKLINPHLPKDLLPLAIDRLGREALATEQLVHPNVIRLLDAELDRAPFFLVQPWIKGRTLDRLLSSVPHLPLTRLLWVLRQTAEGVRAGHEKGKIHLGLEPAHIVIGRTGRVTLLGWSRSHSVDEKAWLPTNQLQLARYTAPECFEENYIAQPSADVYSLGTIIYHTLALQPPFEGQSIEEIQFSHNDQIPEDLVVAAPDCPPKLGALVKLMLSKDPILRPSFREVHNELVSIEIEHLADETLIRL